MPIVKALEEFQDCEVAIRIRAIAFHAPKLGIPQIQIYPTPHYTNVEVSHD